MTRSLIRPMIPTTYLCPFCQRKQSASPLGHEYLAKCDGCNVLFTLKQETVTGALQITEMCYYVHLFPQDVASYRIVADLQQHTTSFRAPNNNLLFYANKLYSNNRPEEIRQLLERILNLKAFL